MRILSFGTYDNLHPGHLNFFKQAKALGRELFVIVALDETVLMVKSRHPLQKEDTRLKALYSVPEIDHVYLGSSGDKYAVIEKIKPDIIALGYDQRAFTDKLEKELEKRGVKCKIRRMNPFHPERYKSSKHRPELTPQPPLFHPSLKLRLAGEREGGDSEKSYSYRKPGVDDDVSHVESGLVNAARGLRKEQTPSESLLWEQLRNRQLDGHKFLRQHPIAGYIVDFFCFEKRLIVEVDGDVHLEKEVMDRDVDRQKKLEELGYSFSRFTNEEVEKDISKVLNTIRKRFSQ